MKVYSFEIPTSHVVPRPFPYGVQYWVISSTNHPQRGIIYKLGIRVGEVDELLYYWPKAEAVMEDTYTELPKLNPPTGNEQGIIRLRFNYPIGEPTPPNKYPEIAQWCTPGDLGCSLWVACTASMEEFLKDWPQAWAVDVVAENMPA